MRKEEALIILFMIIITVLLWNIQLKVDNIQTKLLYESEIIK